MSTQETFVDGLDNVAVQAALARIELTQLKSLPAEGQKPAFEVTSRLVMCIETFLKMHQSFTEVINQMESKGPGCRNIIMGGRTGFECPYAAESKFTDIEELEADCKSKCAPEQRRPFYSPKWLIKGRLWRIQNNYQSEEKRANVSPPPPAAGEGKESESNSEEEEEEEESW